MSYVFYVLGVLGLIGAALILSSSSSAPNSMTAGFSVIYAVSAFVGSMGFFAIGRILDLLGTIAKNSRKLHYLELLDPEIAAEREAEIVEAEQRRADRAGRSLFGFGPKRAVQ
jgi:hypothetical protein